MIVVMSTFGRIVVIFSFCSLLNVRQTNNAESRIHKNIYPYFIPMNILYRCVHCRSDSPIALIIVMLLMSRGYFR